jgi:glycerol kinase
VLNVPVERPINHETTALGAAYLAGLAVGFWSSQEEISSQWEMDRSFTPAMDEAIRDQLYTGWKKAIAATIAFK